MDNKDEKPSQNDATDDEQALLSRRDFLISLTKWSKVVIAGALLGGLLTHTDRKAEAGSWINRRGGTEAAGMMVEGAAGTTGAAAGMTGGATGITGAAVEQVGLIPAEAVGSIVEEAGDGLIVRIDGNVRPVRRLTSSELVEIQ